MWLIDLVTLRCIYPAQNYIVLRIKKIYRFLFSIYGFAVFIIIMLLLLPFFTCCFLLTDTKGGNILYKLCRLWANLFFFFTAINYKSISEEEWNKDDECIYISNHISYLDIPVMMKVTMHRNVRILGKSEMTKIPLFGFIYKKGTVQVNRENPRRRAESMMQLITFLNKKISVFICPEGTFNSTHKPLKKFYDGAFRIAIETQKPVIPLLFLDTYDRLNYKSIFSLNPGKCRVVRLSATATEGLTVNDITMLKEKIYVQMECALIKYQASWIE